MVEARCILGAADGFRGHAGLWVGLDCSVLVGGNAGSGSKEVERSRYCAVLNILMRYQLFKALETVTVYSGFGIQLSCCMEYD